MDDLDFPSVKHEEGTFFYSGEITNTVNSSVAMQTKSPVQKRKVTDVKMPSKLSKEEKERLRKRKYHKALAKGLVKRLSPVVAVSLAIGIAASKHSKNRASTISDEEVKESTVATETVLENNQNEIESVQVEAENNLLETQGVTEKEYEEFAKDIEEQFETYYTYDQSFDDDYITEDSAVYKEINADIDAYAVRYCEQIVYDKIMNLFGPTIETYAKTYGVDPNYIASLIMVEVPDYDFDKDTDPEAIGVGQYKGHLFEGDVFKAYNYINEEYDSYTFNTKELLQNPDLQIKLLCMDVAGAAKKYNYNLYAMLEHHNKGSKSVYDALDELQYKYHLNNHDEVLNIVDPTEITEVINKIGDPNYTSKAMTYMKMCLEQNAFESSAITFQREDGKEPIYINININSYNRS